jgi:hypothetical protein
VGPRASLDAVVKKKFPSLAWTRNPDHPARKGEQIVLGNKIYKQVKNFNYLGFRMHCERGSDANTVT